MVGLSIDDSWVFSRKAGKYLSLIHRWFDIIYIRRPSAPVDRIMHGDSKEIMPGSLIFPFFCRGSNAIGYSYSKSVLLRRAATDSVIGSFLANPRTTLFYITVPNTPFLVNVWHSKRDDRWNLSTCIHVSRNLMWTIFDLPKYESLLKANMTFHIPLRTFALSGVLNFKRDSTYNLRP